MKAKPAGKAGRMFPYAGELLPDTDHSDTIRVKSYKSLGIAEMDVQYTD